MNFLKKLGKRFLYIVGGIVAAAIGVIVFIVDFKGETRDDSKVMDFGLVAVLIGGLLVVYCSKRILMNLKKTKTHLATTYLMMSLFCRMI